MTRARQWHCPPEHTADRTADGPWCGDLPCRGHRATAAQVRAAEVIAWTEGWYPPDPAPGDWADCLTSAAQALAHIHQHKEGTP